MSGQIPVRIRHKFYVHYLKGDPVTWIREKIGISRSSCYNLIADLEKVDPNIELMRALAVNLRRNGSDVSSYANSNRIHNLLEELGMSQNAGGELIEGVVDGCYRENMDPYDAIRAFKEFSESAAEFGHTLQEHCDYFQKLRVQKVQLMNEIKDRRKIMANLIEKHPIIKENLRVFQEMDGIKKTDFLNFLEGVRFQEKISRPEEANLS